MTHKELIGEWFERYGDDIYKLLVYYTGSRDVEDMVQETFVRAFKGLARYRGDANPKTWLVTIARHVSIDTVRRRRPTVYMDDLLDGLPAKEASPEDVVVQLDTVEQILCKMHSVNPKYRDVLLLRSIQDMSPTDTAQILGWTVGKVNVMYHRAVKAAQELLGDPDEGALQHV